MQPGGYEGNTACQQFEVELAAYLEGEDRPAVLAHAQECPFCGVLLGDLEQIVSQSGLMDPEEPPARVWENIYAQLAREGVFRKRIALRDRWFFPVIFLRNPLPVAALACLAVLSAILLAPGGSFERKGAPELSASGETAPFAAPHYPGAVGDLARTVQEMETSYEASEASFEPAVKATYQKSLASLDKSILECRELLQKEPSNTLAGEYLLTAYAGKAEVLADALELDAR